LVVEFDNLDPPDALAADPDDMLLPKLVSAPKPADDARLVPSPDLLEEGRRPVDMQGGATG
jgi:hypothetical protein